MLGWHARLIRRENAESAKEKMIAAVFVPLR
jgi:hypothetical protein